MAAIFRQYLTTFHIEIIIAILDSTFNASFLSLFIALNCFILESTALSIGLSDASPLRSHGCSIEASTKYINQGAQFSSSILNKLQANEAPKPLNHISRRHQKGKQYSLKHHNVGQSVRQPRCTIIHHFETLSNQKRI